MPKNTPVKIVSCFFLQWLFSTESGHPPMNNRLLPIDMRASSIIKSTVISENPSLYQATADIIHIRDETQRQFHELFVNHICK